MSDFMKRQLDKILPAKKTPEAQAPTPADVTEKNPGPDPKPAQRLVVWHVPLKNYQILTCYQEGTDPNNPNNLLTVNVRHNRHFLKGMTVPVNQVQGTTFEMCGRLPRWRGDKV